MVSSNNKIIRPTSVYLLQLEYNHNNQCDIDYQHKMQVLLDEYIIKDYQSQKCNILILNAVLWSHIPLIIEDLWLHYCRKYALVILIQTRDKILHYSADDKQALVVTVYDICKKYGLYFLQHTENNVLQSIPVSLNNKQDRTRTSTGQALINVNMIKTRIVFLCHPSTIKNFTNHKNVSNKAHPVQWLQRTESQKILNQHDHHHQILTFYVNVFGSCDNFVYGGEVGINNHRDNIIEPLTHGIYNQRVIDDELPWYGRILSLTGDRDSSNQSTNDCLTTNIGVCNQTSTAWADIYHVLIFSLRQFIRNVGTKSCIVGLSGGIDSSLVTTLAVDALGRENVHAVFLPSKYTYNVAYDCVSDLIKHLNCRLTKLNIDTVVKSAYDQLVKTWENIPSKICPNSCTGTLDTMQFDASSPSANNRHNIFPEDMIASFVTNITQSYLMNDCYHLPKYLSYFYSLYQTESNVRNDKNINKMLENLQPRIRLAMLLGFANAEFAPLFSCGNKSEGLTGYSSIFGDNCGMFAPLSDLYKTDVYNLVQWRNQNIPFGSMCKTMSPIPQHTITRPPTAELRLSQLDSDDLPDYDTLDTILRYLTDMRYIEKHTKSAQFCFNKDDNAVLTLLIKKFGLSLISKIINYMLTNHFKCHFIPPGPKFYC